MKTNRLIPQILSLIIFITFLSGCLKNSPKRGEIITDSSKIKLFEKVPSSHSGITFNNELIENFIFNHIRYDVVYQGAGVAVGDINNDGLPDFYITGNMVHDKLYLNKGDMKFEDISVKARIGLEEKWSTGVTMADVNNDGLLDIYVCKYLMDDPVKRENVLYINNGNLTFTDRAREIFQTENATQAILRESFRGIATKSGIDPDLVTPNLGGGGKAFSKGTKEITLPDGTKVKVTDN